MDNPEKPETSYSRFPFLCGTLFCSILMYLSSLLFVFLTCSWSPGLWFCVYLKIFCFCLFGLLLSIYHSNLFCLSY